MVGVGAEYELPYKARVFEIFQLWSASFRMPLGLGKVVIFEYIEVALGLLVVNDIGVAGSVSKRKVWRRGANQIICTATPYFDKLLVRCLQWWPNRLHRRWRAPILHY
jgi:hypothetical protein